MRFLFEAIETATRIAPGARSRSMQVQTLIFRKSHGWTAAKAKRWAASHGFKYGKVDDTESSVRLRQQDPAKFRVLRTVHFGDGISAVVGR